MNRFWRLVALGLLVCSLGATMVLACTGVDDGVRLNTESAPAGGEGEQPTAQHGEGADSGHAAGSAGEACDSQAAAIAPRIENGQFLDTFDGSPGQPLSVCAAEGWDIQVHSRDAATWQQLEPIDAQHGDDCSAPPATHHLSGAYADAVFQCRDHIMTAINAGGYGVIYLTPDVLLDLSRGTGTVKFDLSTLRMSIRDWVDVWITPYDDNLTLPFDQGDVDLQGVPRTGIHVSMSSFNGETTFKCSRIDDFHESDIQGTPWDSIDQHLKAAGRAPSATVRDTFELDLSRDHIKFWSPTITGWSACDSALAQLPFDRAVVQFGHHSYNPGKDGSGVPATWHWDNVSIQPAQPFTLIKADRRFVDGDSQPLTFESPAPANGMLRFSANGEAIEVSFDDGRSWSAARVQPAAESVDRFQSYFTPVPAGTARIRIRGKDTANGPFFAQDFSIWAAPG
jgi:hypothetical protein